MQAIAFLLLKKVVPYLVPAAIGAGLGLFFGYHIGTDRLAAAKLALSVQATTDAQAVAEEDLTAAAALAKADANANAAETALATANRQGQSQDATLTNNIALEAAKPGQDAVDAPVLSHTLDSLVDVQ